MGAGLQVLAAVFPRACARGFGGLSADMLKSGVTQPIFQVNWVMLSPEGLWFYFWK